MAQETVLLVLCRAQEGDLPADFGERVAEAKAKAVTLKAMFAAYTDEMLVVARQGDALGS